MYRILEFHSNVFFNRKRIKNPKKNPYLNWSDGKAKEFLGKLLKVISQRRIYPVCCAVNVKVFESYSYGERCTVAGYETTPSHRRTQRPAPYHVAFRLMIGDAAEKVHPDTALHFTFADQADYKERAIEVYDRTREYGHPNIRRHLKGIAFEPPIDWPGLQAADLFVNRWYNSLVQTESGRSLSRENQIIMNILTHKRRDIILLDAAGIERLFAEISPEARRRLRAVQEPRWETK